MKSNDFVKYLTVQAVEKMNQPKQNKQVTKEKASFSTHWFGLVPFSIKMIAERFQKPS